MALTECSLQPAVLAIWAVVNDLLRIMHESFHVVRLQGLGPSCMGIIKQSVGSHNSTAAAYTVHYLLN
jgi:hypothetical protein